MPRIHPSEFSFKATRSPARKSPKRKSPKRKSPKRSPVRRSKNVIVIPRKEDIEIYKRMSTY